MSENKTLQVSLAEIELLDGEQTFEGTPIDPKINEPEVGKLSSFRVSTTDTLVLKVGVVSWPSGAFDVIPYEKVQGLMKHDFLESRGRTSLYVQENGDWMFILRTLKWNSSQQKPNLADASLPELSEIADDDFEELLMKHGAKAVGTRKKLVGETNRNRFQLAMLVEPNNLEAIAVAFTVTRVLAVVKDFGMKNQ